MTPKIKTTSKTQRTQNMKTTSKREATLKHVAQAYLAVVVLVPTARTKPAVRKVPQLISLFIFLQALYKTNEKPASFLSTLFSVHVFLHVATFHRRIYFNQPKFSVSAFFSVVSGHQPGERQLANELCAFILCSTKLRC